MKSKALILFLILVGLRGFAQDTYTLKGYVKSLFSAQKIDILDLRFESTIHNRIDFSYFFGSDISFNSSVRNRLIASNDFSIIPNYSDFLIADANKINLSYKLHESNSFIALSQFDRLNLDMSFGKLQITVGRQRINWGLNYVWNPNDIFNSYSFFDFDYEERQGSDAVRLQYYISEDSKLESSTSIDSQSRLSSLLLYKFNARGYDFQFLGGYYKEVDLVLGFGLAGSINGGGVSSEISYYIPVAKSLDSSSTIVAAFHWDYTFASSLFVQGELLINASKNNNANSLLNNVLFSDLNPKRLFQDRYALFAGTSYQISPLLSASFSAMYSHISEFLYLGPSLSYSLSDNLQLAGFGQYFSSQVAPISYKYTGWMAFMRLKWSF